MRGSPRAGQASDIWPERTEICLPGSGLVAGPSTTLPSLALNLLPWHGQSIVPFTTWSTKHSAWVQTALNALYSPADGWVTTTWAEVKILPPPTGTSLAA